MPAPETTPVMLESQRITESWTALPSFLPLPGMGGLPINAFLLKGPEPMLVDTGLAALGESFMERLENEIDPAELRWIFLSHTDADHIGNLARVMTAAPQARLLTNFLGWGKMGLLGCQPDAGRLHLLDPGARLPLAGRTLIPVRPPYYDAPETLGLYDVEERLFFAADSFGALLPEPAASLEEVEDTALRHGLVTWSSIDAPWLACSDRTAFGRTLETLARLDPAVTISGHLPVSRGGMARLTAILETAWTTTSIEDSDPLAIEHLAAVLADGTPQGEALAG